MKQTEWVKAARSHTDLSYYSYLSQEVQLRGDFSASQDLRLCANKEKLAVEIEPPSLSLELESRSSQ